MLSKWTHRQKYGLVIAGCGLAWATGQLVVLLTNPFTPLYGVIMAGMVLGLFTMGFGVSIYQRG